MSPALVTFLLLLSVFGAQGLLYPTREALWNRMDGVVNREFEASQPPYKMSFKDMINSKYYPENFNGTWISDTEIVYPDQFGGLSIYNVETSRIQTVVRRNMASFRHYEFSADRNYLLLKMYGQQVWSRSSLATYGIMRIRGGIRAVGRILPLMKKQKLRYVTWAPKGNAIACVDYDNNIHYRHSAEAEDIQLTYTGVESVIFNGIPDWVVEEDVFEDNKALWWSPDGSKLVYGVFNDTLVNTVDLPLYGNWHNNRQGSPFLQYPLKEVIHYPKAGTTNPTFALWYADVGPPGFHKRINHQRLPSPPSMRYVEHHFTSISWKDDTTVAVIWMNRVQNFTVVAECPLTRNVKCKEVFEMSQKNGWIDNSLPILFNKYKPSSQFLAILPDRTEKYRFRQLFLVGKSTMRLTKEHAEVTEVLKWTKDDRVYYISTLPGEPGTRHLFKLQIGESSSTCLTCNQRVMSPHLWGRKECDFVSISMSEEGSYYMMTCEGPDIPYSCLYNTQTNSFLSVWTNNKKLEDHISEMDTASVKYLKVGVKGSDQKVQVKLFVPPEVEKSKGGKKWPMVVYVYGGPSAQYVTKQWQGGGYKAYVAGSLGIVFAIIDPRGSGFQGDAWRHVNYRNLGSVEITDIIYVTKYLQDNIDFIDSSKTGVWGISYGGYATLSTLTKDTSGVFKCGASGAPVVKWELYDTYYTERWMSTPQDNPAGYNASTPLWGLENLRHKKFFLFHGTRDDNVHYQQSMLLSAALEEKDILFRQQTYPDQRHSIGEYLQHMYHSLTNFFTEDCFHMNQED